MTKYLKSQNKYRVISEGAIDIRDELPLGTYNVNLSMMEGYFLTEVPNVSVNHKIYGPAERRAFRILNTFKNRDNNTGVLLSGKKGTGKTMLSKLISQRAREHLGFITLVVNGEYAGDDFNRFLSDIKQPAVVMIDEFEKTYSSKAQEALLTLLDGIHENKKLFVLTVNETHKLNQFMIGRPGRLFYHYQYNDLGIDEIKEYLIDKLEDQRRVMSAATALYPVSDISYDILNAVCEEINRYPDEKMSEIIAPVNVQRKFSRKAYEIAGVEGEYANEIKKYGMYVNEINPFIDDVTFLTKPIDKNSIDEVAEVEDHWDEDVQDVVYQDIGVNMDGTLIMTPDNIVYSAFDTVQYSNGRTTITLKIKTKSKPSITNLANSVPEYAMAISK